MAELVLFRRGRSGSETAVSLLVWDQSLENGGGALRHWLVRRAEAGGQRAETSPVITCLTDNRQSRPDFDHRREKGYKLAKFNDR